MYTQNLKKLIEMHVLNIKSLKFKKLFYKTLNLNQKFVSKYSSEVFLGNTIFTFERSFKFSVK